MTQRLLPDPPARARLRWHIAGPLVLSVLAAVMTSSCGSDLLGPASTSSPTTAPASTTSSTTASTTASPSSSASGEVAVGFPVVACNAPSGGPLPGQTWKPSILLAPIPTALVGKVEFYSDGSRSILGPTGWSCIQTKQNDGATGLDVFPPNGPDPPAAGPPPAGTEGVFALFDTTGHTAGLTMVCPFFVLPGWQQRQAQCNGQKPANELSGMPTPDIASVYDAPGVVGSLAGSGGALAASGAVIFPQVMPAVTEGTSIDVASESCALSDSSLCPTVLSDFEVREFPVPSTNGGSD